MKKIIKYMLIFILIVCLIILSINLYMIMSTKKQILTIDNIDSEDIDCILILGAGIRQNKPSPMLEDRLSVGIELLDSSISNRILVSGDHTSEDYDEVNVMKNYLIEKGVSSEKIFMDHAGISTYDSIYRVNKIFKANKIIIVTQEYHLYRALYIANQLDIDAVGLSASKVKYHGQTKRDIREIAARVKDFIKCIIKPPAKHLGEVYNILGNGDTTNDK